MDVAQAAQQPEEVFARDRDRFAAHARKGITLVGLVGLFPFFRFEYLIDKEARARLRARASTLPGSEPRNWITRSWTAAAPRITRYLPQNLATIEIDDFDGAAGNTENPFSGHDMVFKCHSVPRPRIRRCDTVENVVLDDVRLAIAPERHTRLDLMLLDCARIAVPLS